MKFFLFVTSFILLNASNKTCKNKKKNQVDGCYKAKLEVKGGCMNYTIAITEGKFDSSMVLSKTFFAYLSNPSVCQYYSSVQYLYTDLNLNDLVFPEKIL